MTRTRLRWSDLEAAIEGVTKSYEGGLEINNLESTALPNRRAVIEAYEHLLPMVYMGFFATRHIDRTNLRHALSECAYPAYEILVDQISRAISYEERSGRRETRDRDWPEVVVLRLFEQLPEVRRLLNGDLLAAYDGDPAVRSIEEVVFSLPGLRAITAHRIAHILYRNDVPMIPRIISEFAHSKTGIDIHPGASIGKNFFIDHGTGIVIGETAVIGDGVTIYQGVTLGAISVSHVQRGSNGTAPAKRHPTVEDDVTIYTGARILGGDTVIGKGSVIGANAWLLESVPPGTRIMGREDNAPSSAPPGRPMSDVAATTKTIRTT
jgi:serine O-acetyltransferase